MKTKSVTKQRRQARKGWTINDDLSNDYEIVMLDDLDVIDEVCLAEVLCEEDE